MDRNTIIGICVLVVMVHLAGCAVCDAVLDEPQRRAYYKKTRNAYMFLWPIALVILLCRAVFRGVKQLKNV